MVFSDLAREKKIPSVPFLLTDIALSATLLQGDDIHPNALGQPILLNNVWPALQPLLKK
jgi:acyl-CoA thioesterase I